MSETVWKPGEMDQVRDAARREDGRLPDTVDLLHRIAVPHDPPYDLLISRADGHVVLTSGDGGVQARVTRDWLRAMYGEYFPEAQQTLMLRRRILGGCIAAFRKAEILYEMSLGLPDPWEGRRYAAIDAEKSMVEAEPDIRTLERMMRIMPTDGLESFRRIEEVATPEQMSIVMIHVARVLLVSGMELAALGFRCKGDPAWQDMTEEEISEWSIRAVDESNRIERERAGMVRGMERRLRMKVGDGLAQLRDELEAAYGNDDRRSLPDHQRDRGHA